MEKINFFKSKLFFNLVISLIFILYVLNSNVCYHSYWGNLNLTRTFSALFGITVIKPVIASLVINYVLILLLLHNLNKVTRVISYIGYIGMLIVEMLFIIMLGLATTAFEPLTSLYVIVLITLVWIILLFLFKETEVKVLPVKGKKTPIKEVKETSEDDTVTKLKEYKELLDSGVIDQDEFNDMKKALLNKELKKVKE